jgi:hypothetical protein
VLNIWKWASCDMVRWIPHCQWEEWPGIHLVLDGDHPLAKSGLVPLVRLHGERETFSRLIEESVRWDLPFSVVSPTRRRLFRQTARKSRYESVGIDDAPALLAFEKKINIRMLSSLWPALHQWTMRFKTDIGKVKEDFFLELRCGDETRKTTMRTTSPARPQISR